MKKYIFIFLFVVSFLQAGAQLSFLKTYYNTAQEKFNKIVELSNGYIVAGSTASFGAGSSDALIVKFNNQGTIQMINAYGGINDDAASAIIKNNENNFLIAGYSASFSAWPGDSADIFIVKIDSSGNILWSKNYRAIGKDSATCIIQLADSNYLICGISSSFGAGNEDAFLLKIDTAGNEIWSLTYGTSGADFAYSVTEDNNGNLYVTGKTSGSPLVGNVTLLFKTNPTGSLLWSKTMNLAYSYSVRDCWGQDINNAYNNNIIIAGTVGKFTLMESAPFALTVDSSGNVVWCKRYSNYTGQGVKGCSIKKITPSGYFLAAHTSSTSYHKIDQNGNGIWVWEWSNFSGTFDGTPANGFQTSDNGFIMAGTDNYGNTTKGFLMKVQSTGWLTIPCIYNTPGAAGISVSVDTATINLSVSVPAFSLNDSCFVSTGTLISSTHCTSVDIEEKANEINSFSISPNPCDHFTTIQCLNKQFSGKITIDIINSYSEKIFNDFFQTASYKLDSEKFNDGIYLIRLYNDKYKIIYTGKIAVLH